MTSERNIILRDIFLGLSGVWVVFPFSIESPLELSAGTVGITVLVTATVGSARYLSEHGALPDRLIDTRDHLRAHPGQLVVLVAVLIAALLLPLVTVPSTIDEYYAGIAGLYLGFIGYRIVYGIVRPVPHGALERYHGG